MRSIYYIERMFQKVVKTGCNVGCKQREKLVFVNTPKQTYPGYHRVWGNPIAGLV